MSYTDKVEKSKTIKQQNKNSKSSNNTFSNSQIAQAMQIYGGDYLQDQTTPIQKMDDDKDNSLSQIEPNTGLTYRAIQMFLDRPIPYIDKAKQQEANKATNSINKSNPIQQMLDDDQRAAIHSNFSTAYDTATFRRIGFSDQDRRDAWFQQANAEARFTGEEINQAAAEGQINQMGLTAQGIHLRHVIPYSDIAGVLRVATSASTISIAGHAYANAIKAQVTALTALIGREETQKLWNENVDNTGILQSSNGRNIIKQIYRDLAHSQKNLFQGSGTVNMALKNRPDPSVFATEIIGQEQINNLLIWWYNTMNILELNPIFSQNNVYDINSQQYLNIGLHSHDLSRPLGAIHGYSEELEMINLVE